MADSDRAAEGSKRAQQPHSWASFTPEGVADAQRVQPPTSLEGFAAERDLQFRGSLRWGHLLGVMPAWKGRVFNACTGAIAPHRFGYVAHESLQVGTSTSHNGGAWVSGLGGEFYGERIRDPWVTVAAVVTGISDVFEDQDGPFPRATAAVPTTTVAMHVPEAALVPLFRVGSVGRIHGHHQRTDEFGLAGFRVRGDLTQEQRAAILGGPVGEALAPLAARSYAKLHVVCSQLRLTVDGYLTDPGELDTLIGRAVAIADALADHDSEHWPPAPDFAAPLPEAPAPFRAEPATKLKLGPIKIGWGNKPPADAPTTTDPDGWGEGFAQAAKEHGLRYEDPVAFHRSFPRVQAPGTARGVLQGRLPSGIVGRLTVHQHEPTSAQARVAVTFPAPEGTPDTPVGGVVHEPTDMQVAVTDGLVTCWSRTITTRTIATVETSRRALEAARAFGWA